MTEKTSNILRALFGLIIALVCLSLRFTGSTEGSFTYIGAGLGIFMFVGYLKRAFDS